MKYADSPDLSMVKSAYNTGDSGDMGLGQEIPLEEGHGRHHSTLKIPMDKTTDTVACSA